MTYAAFTRRRALRDGLLLAGLIVNLTILFVWGKDLYLWSDAHSWEQIRLTPQLYDSASVSLIGEGAFRFAPAIAWLLYPVSLLPFPIIVAIWLGMDLAAVVILARSQAALLLLSFPPVLLEMLNGNIHLLMALAIWAGLRWPAAWAFLLLTKVTPGIGLLWYAGRREWRNLAVALVVPVGIATVGFLVAPDMWTAWGRSLVVASSLTLPSPLPPLWIRVLVAGGLAVFAGRSNRAWLVPVACLLAMPTIWIQSLALLVACVPLWSRRARAAGASRLPLVGAEADVDRTREVTSGSGAQSK